MTRLPSLANSPHSGNETLPGAIHAALEGIVTINAQGQITMVNPAAERMFGRSSADLLGRDLDVLVPERLRARHAVHVQRFMESDAVELNMAQRGPMVGLRVSGEEFPMESALCKVEMTDGQRYVTALLRDLSEERKLTNLIDQLNQRMRLIFDMVPVAIWITEGDAVVYGNQACARLFGSEPREHFSGRSLFEFLSPGSHERVRFTVAEALADQSSVRTLTGEIARHDGSVRQVEMVIAALPDHQRTLVQMVISDITLQSQERRQLLLSKHTLRLFSASLVDAREEERRRIARELHDELGQRLSALKLELASLDRQVGFASQAAHIRSMMDLVDDTVAATRRIATDLRPPMLDDLGLQAAIEWLARDFARRSGLHIHLQLDAIPHQMDPRAATALYRIVQETLTNCVRHARATEVRIAAALMEGSIEFTIQDDGDGFSRLPPYSPMGSFGLIGIRERVLMLGGQLSISNAPEGGARLVVRLPWAEAHRTDRLEQRDPSQSFQDTSPSFPSDVRP